MRAKLLVGLVVGALASASFSSAAVAGTFICPQPNQINCVPAVKSIAGWHDNGGQTTGNSFTPNNQCANVIKLNAHRQRLLCCYEKCGVFLRDVRATSCSKVSESQFDCH